MHLRLLILLALVAVGALVSTVSSAPAAGAPTATHSLARELGARGEKLDKQIEDIDRTIVKTWNDLVGPLSEADKKAFRRQYPDEAAEYDKICKYYGWEKKF